MNWIEKAQRIGIKTQQDLQDFRRYTGSGTKGQTQFAIELCFKNGWTFHSVQEDGRRVYFVWGVRKNV